VATRPCAGPSLLAPGRGCIGIGPRPINLTSVRLCVVSPGSHGTTQEPRARPYPTIPPALVLPVTWCGHMYVVCLHRGLGLSPGPFPRRTNFERIKIKFAVYITRTPVGRAVSPVLPVCCPEGRSGFDPVQAIQILHKPTNQPRGATWKPMTGPRGTSTTNHKLPCVSR
jgi:hypothetical protein